MLLPTNHPMVTVPARKRPHSEAWIGVSKLAPPVTSVKANAASRAPFVDK